jgi:hypothetical protein
MKGSEGVLEASEGRSVTEIAQIECFCLPQLRIRENGRQNVQISFLLIPLCQGQGKPKRATLTQFAFDCNFTTL